MAPYSLLALLSVTIFAAAHLFAEKTRHASNHFQRKFLSFGGGVAIAYVFIDLLPKLAKSDLLVQERLQGLFPYFERHVYLLALVGFLTFFIIDRSHTITSKKRAYTISLIGYALFNFFIGYAVADPNDPEVQPLLLFTFAIGLHLFTNDFSLSHTHGALYDKQGKWWLVACLYIGWLTGLFIDLSATAIALISAFIGGGVIMNVTRHELPHENPNSVHAFLFGAFFYAIILLTVG